MQDQQLGTGHAVAVRAVGAARRLRRRRRRDLRRRPAAGRRHAGRADRQPTAPNRAAVDRADHDAARPDRLRPHPAHPGRRGHRHRRGGRRHPAAARHPRGQRRRLRLRHRRAALGAEPAVVRQRPARAVPDRRHLDRARPTARSCTPSTSTTHALVAGVNDRVQLADLAARTQPAHRRRAPARRRHRRRPRRPPGSTSTSTIGRDTVIRPGTQLLGAHPHRRALRRSARTPP